MWIVGIVFLVLLIIGTPIAYVLGLTSVFYMYVSENIRMFASTPQFMVSSLLHFGLLAIPLFILTGELMNQGGITTRLIHFANVLIGHVKGGLAYVNVLANMFLASILGSPIAQTAMMSKVMVPEMEKQGYQKEYSGALTVSSAMLAPLIPPSIPFIIYGVVAEVSIAKMFIGGIIPGILLATGFIILIYFNAIRKGFVKSDRQPLKEMGRAFMQALPALAIPVIILVGILSGFFTATEASAVSVLVAFIIGTFIYKEIKLKDLPNILYQTGIHTAVVTIILATAGIFSWVLTFEKVPQLVVEQISAVSDSAFVFLLLVNILLIFIGMFLDSLAALIIIVPVLLPAAVQYGIDPIHFGIIVCLNLVIGVITPPVGAALFIASSVTKIRFESLVRATVPFMIVSFIVLLIVTYVDETALWLSRFVMN